jgi:hypothetical protein
MLKRLFKILLKVLLLLFVLLFVFLLFERVRGEISLAAYKRELAAKGETLDIHKLLGPPVADADNGTLLVFTAFKQRKEGLVLTSHNPPKMQMASIGHAVVGFREESWVDNKTNYNWEQLSADLKTNEAVLAQIRAGLEKPAFDNRLNYSQGFKMQFTNLAQVKQLAYWFGDASQLALHEGNPHEAADDLVAQLHILRLPRNDHMLISELVRDAVGTMAKFTTWEALQADGWTDADLENMQRAWQEPNFATSMARSLEGERILIDTSFGLLRKSNEDTVNVFYWPYDFDSDANDSPTFANIVRDVWKKQVYCRIWRFAWSHQDERHYLETMQSLIELTRNMTREKSYTGMLASLEQLDAKKSIIAISTMNGASMRPR